MPRDPSSSNDVDVWLVELMFVTVDIDDEHIDDGVVENVVMWLLL